MIDFSDSDKFQLNADQIVENSKKIVSILKRADLYDIFQIAIQSNTPENNHPLERYLEKALRQQMLEQANSELCPAPSDISEIAKSSGDTSHMRDSPKHDSISHHSLSDHDNDHDQTMIRQSESPIKEWVRKEEVEEEAKEMVQVEGFLEREEEEEREEERSFMDDVEEVEEDEEEKEKEEEEAALALQNVLEESFREILSHRSHQVQNNENLKIVKEEIVEEKREKEMSLTECITFLFGLKQKKDIEEKEVIQDQESQHQELQTILHSSKSSKVSQALVSARENIQIEPGQTMFDVKGQETAYGTKENGSYQSVTQIPNSVPILGQVQNIMDKKNGKRQGTGKSQGKTLTPPGKNGESKGKETKGKKRQPQKPIDALNLMKQIIEAESNETVVLDIQTPTARTFQNIKSSKNIQRGIVEPKSSIMNDLCPLLQQKWSQMNAQKKAANEQNAPQTARASNEEQLETLYQALESKKQKMLNSYNEFGLNVIFEVLKPKASSKSTFQAGKMISILVNAFREKPLLSEEFQHWSKIQAFISFNLAKFTQEIHALKQRALELTPEQFEDKKFMESIRKINSEFFKETKTALFKAVQTNKHIKIIINLVFCTIQFILSKYREHALKKKIKGKGTTTKAEGNQNVNSFSKKAISNSNSKGNTSPHLLAMEPFTSRKPQKEVLVQTTNLPHEKCPHPPAKGVSVFAPLDLKNQYFRSTTPINKEGHSRNLFRKNSKIKTNAAAEKRDESKTRKEIGNVSQIAETKKRKASKSQSKQDTSRQGRTMKRGQPSVPQFQAWDQLKQKKAQKERSQSPSFICRENLGPGNKNQLTNYKSLISHRTPELTQEQTTTEEEGVPSVLEEKMACLIQEGRSKSQMAKYSRFKRMEEEILANSTHPSTGKVDLDLIENLKKKRKQQKGGLP